MLAPSYAAPISSDPGGGGAGGNAASAPGPSSSYPWVGTVDGTNTGTGNKTTEIPTVSWTARGGLAVDLTLYHNSQTSFPSPFGYKWLLIYQSQVSSDGSGNVSAKWGDGRRYTFANNSGTYSPPPGIHERLVANGSPVTSYDIIEKDQTKYHFANYSGVYVLNTITDENGNQITVNNGTNGGLISITDSSNRKVTFTYNGPSNGFYNTMTDPLGRVINLSYDANGNLSQVTYPTVNGTSYSTTLGYDANHNVTSIKDPRANSSTYSYNSADNSLAWEKDAARNSTTFSYGSPYPYDTTVTDANGDKTIHAYASGRLASVSDPLGYTDYYTYDGDNNVTQKQDRRGNLWNATFDGMGNTLTSTPPGDSASTITYNAHNKPLTVTLPSGRSSAAAYDANDNLTQVQQKDASGNVVATTKLTIGSYGLVSDKYDPNNHHTSYTYDGNGYLASTTTPLGHKTQWAYDALGFQTQRIDAMNRTTTYTPDAWERNVTTTYPDNTTNTYGYDPNSNLTAFANYAGAWSRTYDADNRMLNEYYGGTRDVSHSYDAAGQKGLLSSVTDFDGRVISYTYTVRNELASVSDNIGTESYAYDADGNQLHRYLPNGLRTDEWCNPDGTLHNYYNWNGSNTVLSSYAYTYNADHQITGINEGISFDTDSSPGPTQTTYGYDALGHMTSESRTGPSPYSATYTVDGANNRLTSVNPGTNPFTYDADDEVKTIGGANTFGFSYNANGDRIGETFNGQPTTFSYDYDDQLVGISESGTTARYAYDALGRQVNKTVNGVLTGYYLDGNQVLTEKVNGSNTAQYEWGNDLVRCNTECPLLDGRGNVRQTTSGSQQVISASQPDADGLGSVTSGTASAYSFGAGSGYRQDGVGPAGLGGGYGFQKVGARYYDPTVAGFLTRDTLLSQSPYAYCGGDPVNGSDPSGHHAKHKTKPGQGNSAPPSGPGGAAAGGAAGAGGGAAAGGGGGGSATPESTSNAEANKGMLHTVVDTAVGGLVMAATSAAFAPLMTPVGSTIIGVAAGADAAGLADYYLTKAGY